MLIVGGVVVAFLTVVSIATFYKTPTCTDNIQNQDEQGVDCGGSCPYLCAAQEQPPTVLFTKPLMNSGGRTDIIALVENKNAGVAAKNVSYSMELYGTDRSILQTVSGTLDLPPGATVPVFIPAVASGKQVVASAFLSIDPTTLEWFSMPSDPRILPKVLNPIPGGTTALPRVEAVLQNSSATALSHVQAIVLVRNENKDVIAASSTIVPVIPAQGQATATFTWNSAFSSATTTIEVIPIIPLP